jgi:hypothetical protein
MSSPTFGFNSYVDIAICMAIKDSDSERLKQSVSKWCAIEEARNSASDGTVKDFEVHSPHLLKMEWTKRIREWQDKLRDRGQPVEECTSLNDIQFGALFLQHPFAAMPLWNVMQTFYTLDRLVCGTSKESLDRVTKWELMQPFKYLEAPEVEERWRSSLQELGKEIKDGSHREMLVSQPEDLFFGLANVGKAAKADSKERNNDKKSDTLLRRIDGIYFGISKLENAQGELRRNMKENLKGVKLVDLMLERIFLAARTRFSMIDTYLKIDEHHDGASQPGDQLGHAKLPGTLDTILGSIRD